MKILLLVGALSFMAFVGCIGISVGKRPPSPEPIVVSGGPLGSADAATIAEIHAAASLTFDNQKLESLKQIARRRDLSAVAQVHLVSSAYRCLTFDNQKVDLLRTIISHPAFSDAARSAIVTRLDQLSFDSHREEILRLINQRISRS